METPAEARLPELKAELWTEALPRPA